MNAHAPVIESAVVEPASASDAEANAPTALRSPLEVRADAGASLPAVVIGELIAISDAGCTALVVHPGQSGSAALRAGTTVELRAEHIGTRAVLVFEDGDPLRPVVIGMLRTDVATRLDAPGQVEVSADGGRVTVLARERLELRCGDACITLTRAGQIFIDGDYILSRAAGVNRISGGSVQIN